MGVDMGRQVKSIPLPLPPAIAYDEAQPHFILITKRIAPSRRHTAGTAAPRSWPRTS
jgi:hypothetical protein